MNADLTTWTAAQVPRADWARVLPPSYYRSPRWEANRCTSTLTLTYAGEVTCSRPAGHTGRHHTRGSVCIVAVWP